MGILSDNDFDSIEQLRENIAGLGERLERDQGRLSDCLQKQQGLSYQLEEEQSVQLDLEGEIAEIEMSIAELEEILAQVE